MKKIIILLRLYLTGSVVLARGRLLPADLIMAKLDAVQSNSVQLTALPESLLGQLAAPLGMVSKKRFMLAPGVRIFDENNYSIRTGQLYKLNGQIIGATFNEQKAVMNIWDLTKEEIARLKKDRPHAANLQSLKTK